MNQWMIVHCLGWDLKISGRWKRRYYWTRKIRVGPQCILSIFRMRSQREVSYMKLWDNLIVIRMHALSSTFQGNLIMKLSEISSMKIFDSFKRTRKKNNNNTPVFLKISVLQYLLIVLIATTEQCPSQQPLLKLNRQKSEISINSSNLSTATSTVL